jgi:hypothetical protein
MLTFCVGAEDSFPTVMFDPDGGLLTIPVHGTTYILGQKRGHPSITYSQFYEISNSIKKVK